MSKSKTKTSNNGSPSPSQRIAFIPPSDTPEAAVSLFVRNRADVLQMWRRLALDWPGAIDLMWRVFEYITDGLTLDGERVWHRCALCALQSYAASIQQPDHERLQSCILGLIKPWVELPRFKLAVPGWSWEPQDGVALATSLREGVSLQAITAAETATGPTTQECLLRYLGSNPITGLDIGAFHRIAHQMKGNSLPAACHASERGR